MATIATINGIAEDNIATHNGATASTVTSRNGDTWAHYEAMVATGGTITTDGDFKVHKFTSSGTFAVTTLGTDTGADCLIVAGGGGGGYYIAGGGGAGGMQTSAKTLSQTSYSVTIGAGGTTCTSGSPGCNANSGGNSVFHGTTSTGGGRGGGFQAFTWSASSGGSGGGAAGSYG